MRKTRSILALALTQMLGRAHAHRDVRQEKELDDRLNVSAYITASGEIHLLVWRRNVEPDFAEWLAVLRAWPWPLPAPWPQPQLVVRGDRVGLFATWPLRPALHQTQRAPEAGEAPERVGSEASQPLTTS